MEQSKIIDQALRTVIDPELGLNIVDLGLIYGVEESEEKILVTMTMTSAACPMHNLLSQLAENAVAEALDDKRVVQVQVVHDPPWEPKMMSEEARRILD